MNMLKGFINVGSWENNLVKQTAEFGELSPISYSYSRDIGRYTRPGTSTRLLTFKCVDEQQRETPLAPVMQQSLLDVADYIVNLYDDGRMVDFATPADLLEHLRTRFEAPVFNDFRMGEFVDSEITLGQKMPDYLAWSHVEDVYEYEIRIWFVDKSFRAQYDEYEIRIVPPIRPVSALNGTPMSVTSRLNAVSKSELTEWINDVKGESNVTVIRPYPLKWHDPMGTEATIETPFTIIINGIAGNNSEAINEAIIDFLLTETNVPVETWQKIYPYLFAKLEFYVMPMYQDIAIPEASDLVGVYSGFLNPNDVPNRFPNYTPGYAPMYVQSNYTVMGIQYKSVQLASIGNVLNYDELLRLRDVYPDYINVSTKSSDFARMAPPTQDFIVFLNKLVELAERVGPTTILNAPYSRVMREGKIYVTGRVGDTTITCISKYSYEG